MNGMKVERKLYLDVKYIHIHNLKILYDSVFIKCTMSCKGCIFKILLILEPLTCLLGYVLYKGRYFLLDVIKEIENALYFQ